MGVATLTVALLGLTGQVEGRFTLTALEIPDVRRGAGLALVLQTPGGRTFLYDTGNGYPAGAGWVAGHNSGRDVIAPFLATLGVKELDGVFISHAHYDHFGGLLWLAEHVPIRTLYDSGYAYAGPASDDYREELGAYTKLRAKFRERGAYRELHAGDTLPLDGLEAEVLAPPKAFFGEPNPERRPKNDPPAHYLVNANSLGLRLRHGRVDFLLPGDIQSEDITQSLLPFVDPAKLKAHVLVAPGHGLHGTKEFAEAVRPEISIASVFPRYARGLKSTPMLEAVGAKVYVTGLQGRLRVVSDGTRAAVEAERPEGRRHPGDRIDLTRWKLTLPVETPRAGNPDEVDPAELRSFSLAPHFRLTPEGDGVVFQAPAGGAVTKNSRYPRSELREMTEDGKRHASWSTTAGTHTLRIRQAITRVPKVKPHVVAGQVHDAKDDLIMIRLEGRKLFVESDGSSIGTLDPDYALGTMFGVTIVAGEGRLRVHYNDVAKVDVARKASNCYFKAGVYTQSNPDKGEAPEECGEVVIYALEVDHR